MKFNDLIALAKAGYTVTDIKELLAITTDAPESVPEAAAATEEAVKEEPITTEEPVVDYKALYEESEKKLQEAQRINSTQVTMSQDIKSDEETLKDILKDLI